MTNPQAGETCDTGGATGLCDADCSGVCCGDSVVNTAAGEGCDTGGETATCDADCSVAVCGDGYVNRFTEECDDGNTVDHDACGNDCKVN